MVSASLVASPVKSTNLQNSHIINRANESPIRLVHKNSVEMGLILGQNDSF